MLTVNGSKMFSINLVNTKVVISRGFNIENEDSWQAREGIVPLGTINVIFLVMTHLVVSKEG